MTSIQVLIAGDQSIIWQGILAILETANDLTVVGEAIDYQQAWSLAKEFQPDILLLASDFDGLSLSEMAVTLCQQSPRTKVLIFGEDTCSGIELYKLMGQGVAGYILKTDPADKIITAVRLVAQGMVIFTQEQLARAHRLRQEASKQWTSLTEREREILLLLAEGKSNKQIAKTLTISKNTVGTHIGNLMDKLNVASRIEAAAWAWQHGLDEGNIFSGGNNQ